MNTPESHEVMKEIGNRIDGLKEDFQGFVADLLTLKDRVATLARTVHALNKDVTALLQEDATATEGETAA